MDGQCRIAEYVQGALQGFGTEELSPIINISWMLGHITTRFKEEEEIHCRMENNELPASIHYSSSIAYSVIARSLGTLEKGNLIT